MLVLTQNAYESFSEELKYCQDGKHTWRCVILKFSLVKNKAQNWFTIAADKINSRLGNDGTIYLFPDGDVFILTKHATRKSLEMIYEQLAGLFGPVPETMACQLYELPIHLDFVTQELEAKKPQIEMQAAPAIISNVNPLLDPDYRSIVKSLKERRMSRNKAEILVCDDDPFSSRLVCKTIDGKYTSMAAFDGKETLQAYMFNAPDVLFLDLGLPDMNGLEILSSILDADPEAYIVILSGNGSKDNVLKAMKVGAKGFIAKPFTREKVFQYIEKCPSIKYKENRVN